MLTRRRFDSEAVSTSKLLRLYLFDPGILGSGCLLCMCRRFFRSVSLMPHVLAACFETKFNVGNRKGCVLDHHVHPLCIYRCTPFSSLTTLAATLLTNSLFPAKANFHVRYIVGACGKAEQMATQYVGRLSPAHQPCDLQE